ncbi:MAG: ABC transporter ATP-binding protein [Terracoccus sp.]
MTMLDVKNLTVSYRYGDAHLDAVRDVNFTLDGGQFLGVAGESGSGKSTMALSLVRLLPVGAQTSGQVLFNGEDLNEVSWGRLRAVRWAEASMVFQGAMSALNPVRSITDQIAEPIRLHERIGERAVRARVAQLLDSVGVPTRRQNAYPHELSGGQRQRVMIAMALACRPNLIIADEPTTALDVMVQAQILTLLTELVAESNIGVLMISHDLALLADICDRLAVMYAGTMVETGPADQIFVDPHHPYSRALSRAFPRVGDPASRRRPASLAGEPPAIGTSHTGCPFEPRCPSVMPECASHDIELWTSGQDRESACIRVLPEFATRPDPSAPIGMEATS